MHAHFQFSVVCISNKKTLKDKFQSFSSCVKRWLATLFNHTKHHIHLRMRSVSLIAWLSLLYIKCFGLDVNATLKFPRPEQCFEDNTTWVASGENHKRWLRDMRYEEHDPVNVEEHEIEIHDVAGDESVVLFENGFELVQLAPNILPLLRKIDEKGGIDPLRVGPTTEELETEEKEGSP